MTMIVLDCVEACSMVYTRTLYIFELYYDSIFIHLLDMYRAPCIMK